MEKIDEDNGEDVVAALQALHLALSCDLDDVESRIGALAGADELDDAAVDRLTEYCAARTALHSGLASIAEVLGWVQFKIEEDAEGEVAAAIQPLPTVRGCSIH